MNSCNNPRQNMAAGSGQGSYRNMPQKPTGCERRMPEREQCERRMPEREQCERRMPEREQCERRMPERERCEQKMPERRECEMHEEKKTEWPLGMAYVPWQKWRDLYPLEEGFQCGTIFKELNLPFTGRGMC